MRRMVFLLSSYLSVVVVVVVVRGRLSSGRAVGLTQPRGGEVHVNLILFRVLNCLGFQSRFSRKGRRSSLRE